MPRAVLTLPILAVSFLVFLTACNREDPAPPASEAVSVSVVTLQPQDVTLTRELPGRTTPFLVAEVRPQVSGIVRERLFTEGSQVKAGQPLYQIDAAAFKANDAAARATLARSQAALATARLNAQRSSELIKIQAISQQEDDAVQSALRQAAAEVKAAEAQVEGTRVILDYARITAPIAGRIGKSSVTPGALVSAGQPEPLATIQQLDPIYVDLTVSSAEYLAVRKSLESGALVSTATLPVTVLLEDGTPHAQPGHLAFLEVAVDQDTGSVALRVVVPNPDRMLLPGTYVRAVIAAGARKGALLVPQQGIARDPKGNTTALVVDGEGKAALRAVRVSQAIGDRWLVEDGLEAGDRVIVEGLQKVRPGAPVQAEEFRAVPDAAGMPAAAGR